MSDNMAEMRRALDAIDAAFPVEDISEAPWVVERGSIAWMVREGDGGPQVGNFILEADARWVAAVRNAAAASPGEGARPLDREKVRALFRQMWHESTHPGDGIDESCIECIRKAEDLLAYAEADR